MIPHLENLPAGHDINLITTYGVVLVTIYMSLTTTEENPGHVNLLIHIDIYPPNHEIQEDKKTL